LDATADALESSAAPEPELSSGRKDFPLLFEVTMLRWMLPGALLVLGGCDAVLGIPPAERRPDQAPSAEVAGDGAVECSSDAECLGAPDSAKNPKLCREGSCVPLLMPPACPLLLPQGDERWFENLRAAGPEPLVIGAFAAVDGAQALDAARLDSFDLAFGEVSQALGGVPVAGGAIRPVVAVVCDNSYAKADDLTRAVDHLIGEVRVPAVLSSLRSDDLAAAFERSRGRSVLYMNALAADPSLISAQNDALLWHMLPETDVLADAYLALFDRVIRHLTRTGVLGQDEPLRVALVQAYDYPSSAQLGAALVERLFFNGKSAADNSPSDFAIVNVRTSIGAPAPIGYSFAIDGIRKLAPHVVIAADPDEFLDTILPGLEAGSSDPEPFYLLSPWHVRKAPLRSLRSDTYQRVAGVTYAGADDPNAYDDYLTRFQTAYPNVDAPLGLENFYDAPYYVLYSAVAARGTWPLIGADLALGMRQLLRGPRDFSVGPNDLSLATMALEAAGASITLNGTLGPPSFDLDTGVRADTGSVWCVDAEGNTVTDVLRVGASGELVGNFPCFDFED
jgi:hypothetical protein